VPNDEQQAKVARKVIPLVVPPDWPRAVLPGKRVRLKLPLVGPVTFRIPQSKYRMLDRMVEENLKGRDLSIEEAWSEHPQLLGIVRELRQILDKELWGFEPAFIPEDSYPLLGQWLTGDLCEIEAMMAIEERFGVNIPKENPDPATWTMLELVQFLQANRRW